MKNFTEATETDKTPSADDAERSYRQALKLERERERKRRRYRKNSMWALLESGRCPTWDAAKTLYWTHLKKLLNIFCGR